MNTALKILSKCSLVLILPSVLLLTGATVTNPQPIDKPSPITGFSSSPEDAELFSRQILPVALVPEGGSKSMADNQALASALTVFLKRSSADDMSALTNFIQANPHSRWNLALLINLGELYLHTGYFSRAMDAWKQAWELAKSDNDPHAKQLADYAVTQYLKMNARVGRKEELKPMLGSLENRPMQGNAGVTRDYLKSDLYYMEKRPEISYRCGPFALISILKSENKNKQAYCDTLLQSKSSEMGFTLAQVHDLALKAGMKTQMVQRQLGARIMVPSVVHWKLNHYAAIVAIKEGKYVIQDPTFGMDFLMSQDAIDAESSGYFLVEGDSIPKGYTAVNEAVSKTVYGRGFIQPKDPGPCKQCDKAAGGGSGSGDCSSCQGMAQYSIKLMLVSLAITDTPYWFNSAVGPTLSFTLRYNQRDAINEPVSFNQSNFGSCWGYDFMSYVIDDPTQLSSGVKIYVQGGGVEAYGAPDGSGNFPQQIETNALLTRTIAGNSVTYTRTMPDGSEQIYNQTNGVTAGTRFVFLTQIIDPQGRSLQITYDAQYRIKTVTDATGHSAVFGYTGTNPLEITSIGDSQTGGRSATFGYDTNGNLTSITDMLGIKSQFTYTPGTTNLSSMTTPYGTTSFSIGSNSANNDQTWIEVTNAIGQIERVESIDQAPIPDSDPAKPTYTGASFQNQYLSARNVFYWDRKTYITFGHSDYTKAKIYHFLHTPDGLSWSGTLESTKSPYENRVWYAYPGQSIPIYEGTSALPAFVGRVLDDGTSQVTAYQYNGQANITKQIDPLKRETDYLYAANGIDQIQVNQINPASSNGYDIVSKSTYNGNHQPLTETDAAGQTTKYTYTTDFDIQTITTPPTAASSTGETTTYTYGDSTHPHLPTVVTGAVSGATTSYTYDSFNRVASWTDSEGYTLSYSYDNLDNLTQITYPDGTTEKMSYTLMGQPYLDMTSMTDRLGRTTSYYYDGIRENTRTVDSLGRITQYQWCYCGALQGLIDPAGNVSKWAYDIEGRLLSKTYPDNSKTVYSYENTTKRLKSAQDALGQLTTYMYNSDDTLATVTYSNTVQPTPNVGYKYDTHYNRITTLTDGVGTTQYTYVPVGSLGANKVQSITGPLTNETVSYSYDSLGRNSGITINGVSQSIGYDILDRISTSTNALGVFNYGYLRNTARISSFSRTSGQTMKYSYFGGVGSPIDPRLQEIQNLAPNGTAVLSDFKYQYNAVGDITNWIQTQGTTPVQNANYSYDAVDRLTSATLTTPVTGIPTISSYDYDAVDNRLSEQRDNLVTKGTFNNLNQLTGTTGGGSVLVQGTVNQLANVAVNGKASVLTTNTITPPSYTFSYKLPVATGTNTINVSALNGSGITTKQSYPFVVSGITANSYTYDADGNCTGDGIRSYKWDAANRLVQITQGSNTYQFAYDGMGKRVREIDNGSLSKQWIWAGSQVVEEQNSSNVTTKRFYNQGEQIGGVSYFYTRDHLGSVRELTDSTGTIQASYRYDSFGRVSKIAGSIDADFQYAGYYAHLPTGLNLTVYRAYDPNTSRWLSRDPMEEDGGINLYGYVGDNPVDGIDPDGLAGIYDSLNRAADAGGKEALAASQSGARDKSGKLYEYGGRVCKKCESSKTVYSYTSPPDRGHDAASGTNGNISFRDMKKKCSDLGPGWEDAGYYHSHPNPGAGPPSAADVAAASPDKPVFATRTAPSSGGKSPPKTETWRTDGGKPYKVN